jgi:hypothetical protein
MKNIGISLLAFTTGALGQEPGPPPVCLTCQPPESDLLPMLVIGVIFFSAGWLVSKLFRRKK